MMKPKAAYMVAKNLVEMALRAESKRPPKKPEAVVYVSTAVRREFEINMLHHLEQYGIEPALYEESPDHADYLFAGGDFLIHVDYRSPEDFTKGIT